MGKKNNGISRFMWHLVFGALSGAAPLLPILPKRIGKQYFYQWFVQESSATFWCLAWDLVHRNGFDLLKPFDIAVAHQGGLP
jgi:hypothetical protein